MGACRFGEIGSDDGINSNCANLVLNFGWHGLFIDSNGRSIRRGEYFYSRYPHPWWYQPKFVLAHVTPDSINGVLQDAGFTGEVELLSIDIDGDDYWIWKAITVLNPKVVIIETHVMFGMKNIVVPYLHPDAQKIDDYNGASPVAMQKLALEKGYRLIGANALGFNFIFLRADLVCDALPAVELDSVLRHESIVKSQRRSKDIEGLDYATPIE